MKCRKFEDDSCTTIAACSQDPATLRAKALALAKNIEDLSRAKAKVQSAQSRRRKSRIRRQAGTELDCDALEAKVAEINNATEGSDELSEKSTELAEATITCDDTTVLESIEEQLAAKEEAAREALEAINKLLVELGEETVDAGSSSGSGSPPSVSTEASV